MTPAILYVMGVSGSGKTTIGKLLSEATGLPFFDADDFHPAANKEKMKAGKALDDNDRSGWLSALNQLAREQSKKSGAIIACSALKEKYRQVLVEGIGINVLWIFLRGDFETIRERLNTRKEHFMPASLLESQFATLEPPKQALVIDIANSPRDIVDDIIKKLKNKPGLVR